MSSDTPHYNLRIIVLPPLEAFFFLLITKEKHPKRIYAKAEIKTAFIGGDS